MRISLKLIPALLVALLLTLAIACKSGGSSSSSSNEPVDGGGDQSASDQTGDGAGSEDALVLSGLEALGRSADGFQEEVESLQGEMSMDMSMGEMTFGFNGDFAFQSPDQMHMTMAFTGGDDTLFDLSQMGDMEMLMEGENIYINMPLLGGWVKASLDDLGVDGAQFRELLSDQSPFDYSELVSQLGDDVQVQDLGIEEMNGGSYRHYRISSDLATLMESVAGTLGEDFATGAFPTDGIGGPITMDVWLDTETLLPYKLTAEGSFGADDPSFEALGGEAAFSMTIVINDYNGNITFPAPPADAIDFSELGGDMFGDFQTE